MAVAQENLYASNLNKRRNEYWNKDKNFDRNFQSQLNRFPREFYRPESIEVDPENEKVENDEYDNEYTRELARARKENISRYAHTFGKAAEAALLSMKGPRAHMLIEIIRLSNDYRRKIKEYDNSPFVVLLIFAIIIDVIDIFTVATATWPLKLIIFLSLLGTGHHLRRYFIKFSLKLFVALLIDIIPIVGKLPLTTLSILGAWRSAAKEAEEAKKNLTLLEEKTQKEFGTSIPETA